MLFYIFSIPDIIRQGQWQEVWPQFSTLGGISQAEGGRSVLVCECECVYMWTQGGGCMLGTVQVILSITEWNPVFQKLYNILFCCCYLVDIYYFACSTFIPLSSGNRTHIALGYHPLPITVPVLTPNSKPGHGNWFREWARSVWWISTSELLLGLLGKEALSMARMDTWTSCLVSVKEEPAWESPTEKWGREGD